MYDDYQRGWRDSNEKRIDQRYLNSSGGGWRALAFVLGLYGTMIAAMMLAMAYTDLYGPALGWDGLRQPFATNMTIGGIVAAILGVFCYRHSNTVYARKKAAFETKWREREDEAEAAPKTNEGMQEALAKPLVPDDLKLITMASIRLTGSHPDLADQLAILKVRIQKVLNA